jgi:hypothetical protein
MLKASVQQKQTENPSSQTTPKKSISWKKILASVGVIAIVAGLIAVAIWYPVRNQTESSPVVTTDVSTPSSKQATPSAKKDETADWKTYTSKKVKVKFKHPLDWEIIEEKAVSDKDVVVTENNNTVDGVTVDSLRIKEGNKTRIRIFYIRDYFGGFDGAACVSEQIVINGKEEQFSKGRGFPKGNSGNYVIRTIWPQLDEAEVMAEMCNSSFGPWITTEEEYEESFPTIRLILESLTFL